MKKGGYRGPAKRHADVYVFALLAHTDKLTVDPLNINQWEFYVLPTTALDERKRSQHSITLKSLEDLSGGKVDYVQLAKMGQRLRIGGVAALGSKLNAQYDAYVENETTETEWRFETGHGF